MEMCKHVVKQFREAGEEMMSKGRTVDKGEEVGGARS